MIIHVVMQNDALVRAFCDKEEARRYVDNLKMKYIKDSEYNRPIHYWIASVFLTSDENEK